MGKTSVTALLGAGFLMLGCTQQPSQTASQSQMWATFSNMSEAGFAVEAVAPPDVIREYAICKAVWFAEKQKASGLSLSDPVYGPPGPGPLRQQVPADWISVKATAYVTTPNPSGNPTFTVADKASQCRQMWDWYR